MYQKYDRNFLIVMFKLMSKKEIDHVIDRAMHALSECNVMVNRANSPVASYDEIVPDAQMEFEMYYFIISEGLRQAKVNKRKLWAASTPHIQATMRRIALENQTRMDQRRGRAQRAEQERQRRAQRAARQRELHARAARYAAARARHQAQGNRAAVVAHDIEMLTTPGMTSVTVPRALTQSIEELRVAPINRNWQHNLEQLRAAGIVTNRSQGSSSATVPPRSARR